MTTRLYDLGTLPAPLPVPPTPAVHRVMVVDDHVDTTTLLSSILQRSGYEVAIANDGAEALRVAESFGPHVVLLDLVMPDMHGFEVARRLREVAHDCHLIAVTGWGRPEDRDRFKTLGFRDHLMKPFEPSVILDLLNHLNASESIAQ